MAGRSPQRISTIPSQVGIGPRIIRMPKNESDGPAEHAGHEDDAKRIEADLSRVGEVLHALEPRGDGPRSQSGDAAP